MFSQKQTIANVDPDLWQAIEGEMQRQEDHIELIASENYASPAVMQAQGSVLTNKYAGVIPGSAIMAVVSMSILLNSLQLIG